MSIRSPFLLANLSQVYQTSNFFTWLQSKTKKVQFVNEICECRLHKHYEGNLGFNYITGNYLLLLAVSCIMLHIINSNVTVRISLRLAQVRIFDKIYHML